MDGDWNVEWKVTAPLNELKALLGLPLLVEFCRCSVAADRLVSLGDFALFNDERAPRLDVPYSRNLQTMFWLTCGTLHEAIAAIEEMEALGVEGVLASFDARRPWIELRSVARRWADDPVYRRVRNKIAFHLDRRAIRRGINAPGRDAEPAVWKKGNSPKDRTSTFVFAQDCLVSAMFPSDLSEAEVAKQLQGFTESILNVHLGFSGWTQELFIEATRGAAMGLKLQPIERPKHEGFSDERMTEIESLMTDAADGTIREALRDLVNEVGRLRARIHATSKQPDSAAERRDSEEKRLRSIESVAREFVRTGSPVAEARLRQLVGIESA